MMGQHGERSHVYVWKHGFRKQEQTAADLAHSPARPAGTAGDRDFPSDVTGSCDSGQGDD